MGSWREGDPTREDGQVGVSQGKEQRLRLASGEGCGRVRETESVCTPYVWQGKAMDRRKTRDQVRSTTPKETVVLLTGQRIGRSGDGDSSERE